MNKPIFFLSHSSEDKAIVRDVENQLGQANCWFDEGEIRLGEVILEKIDRGIADSRIFVLFWSQHSAKSIWVKEELSQARIRTIRDRGFRLAVVRIDDTDLPDYLSTRSYVSIDKGLEVVVESLKETAKDLTPSEIFLGTIELKDSFQNRESEIDKLENLVLNKDYGGILILGLQGMGKTTLVRLGMAKLFPNLTPCWVDIYTCHTPLRFISAIARPLSIAINPEEVASHPLKIWKERILPEISGSEKLFVVLDNFETSDRVIYSKQMFELLDYVVNDLLKIRKQENPGLIVISSSKPKIKPEILLQLGAINVRALRRKYMVRALRYYVQRVVGCADLKLDDLDKLAETLRGYPLALKLAAEQIAEQGIDLVLGTIEGLHELLIRLAQELMAGIRLSEKEREVLILLAVTKTQLRLALAEELLEDDLDILDDLASKQVLDLTGGAYSVHDVLRDYVLESMADPEEIKNAHSKLFELYNKNWKKSPLLSAASAELASMAYFHAITAERETDAYFVKTAYQEETKGAAIELYRRGDYKTALIYLQRLQEMDSDLEPILRYYYALCLNRRKREDEALKIIDELIGEDRTVSRYLHSKGIILRNLGRDKEALESFRRAVAVSKRKNTVALSSFAGQLRRMKKPQEGLEYAKEAFAMDPSNSQVISVLVSIYHDLGDNTTGLAILEEALNRRQTDTRLHARAGYIAKDMGEFIKARKHLLHASQDPSQPQVITALADVYIELKEYDLAENVLEKYHKMATKDASYWSTKANILRHKENFPEALKSIEMALKLESKNPVHYGGACQLHIDMGKISLREVKPEEAHLHIETAKDLLYKGLALDSENEVLLTIKKDLERLDSSLF